MKKVTKIGKFIFNNDLSEIKFSFHNNFHFFGSVFLGLLFGFKWAYTVGILWEITDGFKPWFTGFQKNPRQNKLVNYLRENLLYADGFSLQDALIFDLPGSLIGAGLRIILVLLLL